MAHPAFTCLLARQRSGTHALRSILGTNPDIACFDEVFEIEDRESTDPLKRASNYFTFLPQYCAGDVTRAFPDAVDTLFDDYLAYLRPLAGKPHALLDVKYNSTHHITGTWRTITEPTLFALVQARELAVLHLVRRNYLRSLLSHLKAWESKTYYKYDAAPQADARVTVYTDWALPEMERWRAEDELVAAAFEGYAHYLRVEYDDLFPDATGAMSATGLEQLRAWFGVSDQFSNHAALFKQSSLPLADTIANFDEVRRDLAGTRFAYCLDGEGAYR